MVADGSSLLLLLQMLHSSPSCREGALHVLYALASTAELAWAAAKHGGVVYILALLLPLQGKYLYILLMLFKFKSILLQWCDNRTVFLQKKFHCSKELQQPHC